MVVAVAIGVVLIAMVVTMKWADRRDRRNGHVNRGMADISSTIRTQRNNARVLRHPAGRGAARSPHDLSRHKNDHR
jgi:hypothetical protein